MRERLIVVPQLVLDRAEREQGLLVLRAPHESFEELSQSNRGVAQSALAGQDERIGEEQPIRSIRSHWIESERELQLSARGGGLSVADEKPGTPLVTDGRHATRRCPQVRR